MTVTNTGSITVVGAWSTGANAGGWPLPNGPYLTDESTGKGSKYVTFTPNLATNGYYDVYLWWVYASNRATSVPVDIASATTTNRVYINEQINVTNWFKVASSNYFTAGGSSSVTIRNVGTSGYVVANAVRWMPLGSIAPQAPSLPMVEVVASDGTAGEFPTNTGRFTVVCPNGVNPAPLTVYYSMGGSAQPGVDYAALPGSVIIPGGTLAASIPVTPLGGNLTNNQETITLSLAASTNYSIGTLSNATVNLQDWPYNVWKRARFTPAQLASPAISGDSAIPAQDGLPNLLKYALGLPPLTPAANPFHPVMAKGHFTLTYPQAESAPDVALSFLWSPDLFHWFSGPGYFQTLAITDQVTNQLIQLQATLPATTNAFIRASATRL